MRCSETVAALYIRSVVPGAEGRIDQIFAGKEAGVTGGQVKTLGEIVGDGEIRLGSDMSVRRMDVPHQELLAFRIEPVARVGEPEGAIACGHPPSSGKLGFHAAGDVPGVAPGEGIGHAVLVVSGGIKVVKRGMTTVAGLAVAGGEVVLEAEP